MERGEVYYLKVDNSYGNEMAIGRPVVVLTATEYIEKFPTVTVAFLTTSSTRFGIKVRLRTPKRQSWARCDQVQTVDKEKLTDFMCKLKVDEMDDIDDALSLTVGLKRVEEDSLVVEKPTISGDLEKIRLQVELDLFKSLYTDLVKQITDARFERQVVVETPQVEIPFIPKDEPVVAKAAEKIIVEEPKVDTEELKKMMSTPNEEMSSVVEPVKKRGRPPKTKDTSGKANVNTDDWETISKITGMSQDTARNIVRYRGLNGEFKSLEELLFVRRFGRGCLIKYRQMLEV